MPKSSVEFDALGTHWKIESDVVKQKYTAVKKELDQIDKVWSRFRDDSLVTEMSQKAGTFLLTPADIELITWYKKLYDVTDGLITPLIGQALSDAGYDKDYSLSPEQSIANTPSWNEVIELGSNSITLLQPWLIDVGAAGKGFAIDQITNHLGQSDYVIDASGDIRTSGSSIRVGLEDPRNPAKLIGVANIQNVSICGSAVTRRAWGSWHHIINPVSSQPTEDIIATWAICDTAMHADGLATALFFADPAKLQDVISFEYCVIYRDGRVVTGGGNSIELFTEEP